MTTTQTTQTTRIYLRKCRWDNRYFYSTTHNTLYCSDQCRKEANLQNKKEYSRTYRRKHKKILLLQKKGTFDLKKKYKTPPITYLGVSIPWTEWLGEYEQVQRLRKSTFSTPYSKGNQLDLEYNNIVPGHHHATRTDEYHFSISYLKEAGVKCPECDSVQNEVNRGMTICRECGLILLAPALHPGFVVDDTIPLWKVAPTVQDVNKATSSLRAFKLAYSKYWEQVKRLNP